MRFDKHYTDYFKDRVSSLSDGSKCPDEEIVSHFIDLLSIKKSDITLDIGCSFGRFSHLLRQYSETLYGIDVEPAAIDLCRSLNYTRLEVCSMEHMPFADGTIDKGFCWGVFDCAEQETAILETHRILKDGGKVLVTGKNIQYSPLDIEAFVAERNARLKAFPNHFTDVGALIKLAPTIGFEVEHAFAFEKRGDFGMKKYFSLPADNERPFYEYLLILRKISAPQPGLNLKFCDSSSITAREKAMLSGFDDLLDFFRNDYKLKTRLNQSGSKPIVHLVHHVDTEGPLCEPISELFVRIEETLGITLNLKPTQANLLLLQSEEYVYSDESVNQSLKKIIHPSLLEFKENWDEVGEMLDRILDRSFRGKYQDSFGNGWIYNWHIIDHVGFEKNRRSKALGYQTVFDFYQNRLTTSGSTEDSIQWHFHPIPFNREVHHCATSYLNSYGELSQIIARRLIDKNWFPVVNRAGFHTVRPDSNWWLEQWMPFDASNQSTDEIDSIFTDNVNGRFGDWRGAPSDWSIYNPDLYDWRKKGTLKRSISRCLNMKTRFRNITVPELEKAFARARDTQQDVYVGITNHDFREMSTEIDDVYRSLKMTSERFPDVAFRFNDTVSAFRSCLNYSEMEVSANAVALDLNLEGRTLVVSVKNGKPFGSQPFLAMKTRKKTYHTDNLDFGPINSKEYYYTFDISTFELKDIETIAVAANDAYGNTSIKRIDL